jgi:hypothetical protein
MFEVGDMVICTHLRDGGYGFVVEAKSKANYKSLNIDWYAICFFKRPDEIRWYEGKELWRASDVQHR